MRAVHVPPDAWNLITKHFVTTADGIIVIFMIVTNYKKERERGEISRGKHSCLAKLTAASCCANNPLFIALIPQTTFESFSSLKRVSLFQLVPSSN